MSHDVAVLVSGGKDSILSLWVALHKYNVTSIINIVPSKDDSQLFHYENSKFVKLISEMLNLNYYSTKISSDSIDDEVNVLTNLIKEAGVDSIVTGGILSEFQRFKFNRAAEKVNVRCYNPIWRKEPELILNLLINNKFKVIIVSVSSLGLGKDFIGKLLDKELLSNLIELKNKYGLSIIGEGGESRLLFSDAPFYPSELVIEDSEIIWDDKREVGWLRMNKISLKRKTFK